MATLSEIMAELEAAGTAQNRKVYPRHGAAEPMFGVSYKELGRIGKTLRGEHALAIELWATGNHDARVLALRIADPEAMTTDLAHSWLTDVDNYILAEELGRLVSRSLIARAISDQLRDVSEEWPASLGWFIVACTAEQQDVWSVDDLRGSSGADSRRDLRAAESGASRDERRTDFDRTARRQSTPVGARDCAAHRSGAS